MDERLPRDWKKPERSLGFLETLRLGGMLRKEMDRLLESEADEGRKEEARQSKAEGLFGPESKTIQVAHPVLPSTRLLSKTTAN